MGYVVLADSTDRAAWLEARKQVVTASDVASLMGFGGKTRAALLKEKVTGVEVGGEDIGALVQVQAGRHLEDGIIAWFAADHWESSVTASRLLMSRTDAPWLAATPDAIIREGDGAGEKPLEVKCCGADTRANWCEYGQKRDPRTGALKGWPLFLDEPVPAERSLRFPASNLRTAKDDAGTPRAAYLEALSTLFRDVVPALGPPVAPIKYWSQHQVQMYVLGASEGWITCCMGGTSRLDIRYELHEPFIELMLSETELFWDEVLEGRKANV